MRVQDDDPKVDPTNSKEPKRNLPKDNFIEVALQDIFTEDEDFPDALSEEELFAKVLLEKEALAEDLLKEKAFAKALLEEELFIETLSQKKSFSDALLDEEKFEKALFEEETLLGEKSDFDRFSDEEEFTRALFEEEAFVEASVKEDLNLDKTAQEKTLEQDVVSDTIAPSIKKEDEEFNIPLKKEFQALSLQEFESTQTSEFEKEPPEVDQSQREDISIPKGILNVQEFLNYCNSCKNQSLQKETDGGVSIFKRLHYTTTNF